MARPSSNQPQTNQQTPAAVPMPVVPPRVNFSDINWIFSTGQIRWIVGIVIAFISVTITVVTIYAKLKNGVINLENSLQTDEPLLKEVNTLLHENIGKVDRIDQDVNRLLDASLNPQTRR